MKPIAEPYFITYGDKKDYVRQLCVLLADDIVQFNTYYLYVFYPQDKEWKSEIIHIHEDFLKSKWYDYCNAAQVNSNWIEFAMDNFIKNLMVNEYRDNVKDDKKEVIFAVDVQNELVKHLYTLLGIENIDKQYIDILWKKASYF